MKIVFMGTPEFAVPSLQTLLNSNHRLIGVVTAPDKPAGRGLKMTASPVKRISVEHGIHPLQPEKLDDPDFLGRLRTMDADCFVVVAFQILPKAVFSIPPKGTFNCHASLLPKYRGAAPINWALIHGERETGVTTFFIEKSVDTGEILVQRPIPLDEEITAGELHDRLAHLGAQVVLETVDGIEQGTLMPKRQNGFVTKAPKLTKELSKIEWHKPSKSLHNLIRGLSPVPGCRTQYKQKMIKLLKSRVVNNIGAEAKPGTIVAIEESGEPIVKTGKGVLAVCEVKPEGKRSMTAAEFCRGYHIKVGDVFG